MNHLHAIVKINSFDITKIYLKGKPFRGLNSQPNIKRLEMCTRYVALCWLESPGLSCLCIFFFLFKQKYKK
jgi:hypothetical protein